MNTNKENINNSINTVNSKINELVCQIISDIALLLVDSSKVNQMLQKISLEDLKSSNDYLQALSRRLSIIEILNNSLESLKIINDVNDFLDKEISKYEKNYN